jgi:hypothetical protein
MLGAPNGSLFEMHRSKPKETCREQVRIPPKQISLFFESLVQLAGNVS